MSSSGPIMCLSHVLIIVWAFMTMAAAQLHCDPITQYEKEGRCCLKCDPGTHMSSSGTCEEPKCKECEENEYQEMYTTATRCERQEYCDPNKNFKWRDHENKKKRIPCLCEDGFHCSSEACLTCVPHRNCPPGFGARSLGNHTHDTVCEKCPDGEFSSKNAWNSVCQKWKACENNFYESKPGTGESDVDCEPTRKYVISAVVISTIALLVIIVVGSIIFYKRQSKQGYFNVNPKSNIEAHPEETLIDCEGAVPKNPEENEDEPSLLQPSLLQPSLPQPSLPQSSLPPLSLPPSSLSEQAGVTANGNFVVQEMGKMDVLPRQESQTDTTESFCP